MAEAGVTGRPDRFRDFYNRALPRVYSYLHQRVGADAEVARALTTETFESLVAEWPLDSVERAVERALDLGREHLVRHLTKQGGWQSRLMGGARRSAAAAPTDVSPAEAFLHSALQQLNPLERAAVILHYMDDLAVADLAEMLGKSVRASASLIERGEAHLTAALEDSGDV